MADDGSRTISRMNREVLHTAMKWIATGIYGAKKARDEFVDSWDARPSHNGINTGDRADDSSSYRPKPVWEFSGDSTSSSSSSRPRRSEASDSDRHLRPEFDSDPAPMHLGPHEEDFEFKGPTTARRRFDFEEFDEWPTSGNSLDDTILPSTARHSSLSSVSKVDWVRFGMKIVVYVSTFGIATHLLDLVAEREIDLVSVKIMSLIGLPGLFILVFLADVIPQPFTYVPLIFIAIRGNIEGQVVFAICSAASYAAALCGYVVGGQLRHHFGPRIFYQLCEEYPFVPDLMQRRGPVGFAVAILLPIPLAIVTWTAGCYRVDFACFMVACMMRMQKITIFIVLSLVSGKMLGLAILVFTSVTVATLKGASNFV